MDQEINFSLTAKKDKSLKTSINYQRKTKKNMTVLIEILDFNP